MAVCPAPDSGLGLVRSVLETVDCHAQAYSQAGYLALTGPHSIFSTALTMLLTIYVAVTGIRLMFGLGAARLTDAPVIALKIGVILSLTLSWSTFQTLVFGLSSRAPLQIAQTIAEPARSGSSSLAHDPIAGLQVAYDQLGQDAALFGQMAGPNPQILRGGEAAAAEGLWKAQAGLFMSTVGVLAISSIAVGVLAAVGPIFIALFLFAETRGLFAGWLRALIAAALAPMLCWITTTVLLVAIEPWLVELARGRDAGTPDLQTATVVSAVIFIFCAAQAALMGGVGLIASGFHLPVGRRAAAGPATAAAQAAVAASPALSRAERLASQMQSTMARERMAATAGASLAGGTAGAAFPPTRAALAAAGGYRRDAHFDRYRKLERKS